MTSWTSYHDINNVWTFSLGRFSIGTVSVKKMQKKKDKKNKDQNLNLVKRKFSGEKGLSIKERRFDFHNPLIAH